MGHFENKKTISIQTMTLDFYLKSFKSVSLISIDTEDHEPQVLEGAKETLKVYKPFKEIVADSNAVLFFDPNSLEDMSEKISVLLSDKMLRDDKGKKSREHIYKLFETNKIVDNNINFYYELNERI